MKEPYGEGGPLDAPLTGFLVGLPVFAGYFGVLLNAVPKRHGHGLRQRLRTWFPSSSWNPLTEATNGIFSLLTSFLLILETYTISTFFLRWSYATDAFVTCFFGLNFMLAWYIAISTRYYLTSPHSIVDIITILPSLLAIILGYGSKVANLYKLLRVFRLFRILRVYEGLSGLRLLKAGESTRTQSIAVNNQFTYIVVTIFVVLFVLAGIVNAMVVNEDADWGLGPGIMAFHDALYFAVVTVSTVGYGDLHPDNSLGRIIMSLLIVMTFVFLPLQTARIIHLMSIRPKYSGSAPPNKAISHIIIGCDVSCVDRVRVFLNELFADSYVEQRHVVLLVPANPSFAEESAWNGLIVQWVEKLTFLKGDLRNPTDLTRAAANGADACFILTNSASGDPLKDDKVAFMRAITVHEHNPFIKLYVLVTHRETRRHLLSMGLQPSHVISTNEMVQKMVAQTCVNGGTCTLLANVITASPELADAIEIFKNGAHEDKDTGLWSSLRNPQRAIRRHSYERMMRGVKLRDVEVAYICSLGNVIVLYDQLGFAFEGISVQNVTLNLFEKCGAVLIAVVKRYDKDGRAPYTGKEPDPARRGAMLYPGGDYLMEKDDVGYFLARTRVDVMKIAQACTAHMNEAAARAALAQRQRSERSGSVRSMAVPLSPTIGGLGTPADLNRAVSPGALSVSSKDSKVGTFRDSFRNGTFSFRRLPNLNSTLLRPVSRVTADLPNLVTLPMGHIVVIAQSVVSVWSLVRKLSVVEEVQGISRGKPKRVVVVCKGFSSHEHEGRRLEKALKNHPDYGRVTIVTGSLDSLHLHKARITQACLVVIQSAAEMHISSSYTVAADSEDRDAWTIRLLGDVLSISGATVRVVCDLNMASSAEQHQVLTSRVRRLWVEQLCADKAASRVSSLSASSSDPSARSGSGRGVLLGWTAGDSKTAALDEIGADSVRAGAKAEQEKADHADIIKRNLSAVSEGTEPQDSAATVPKTDNNATFNSVKLKSERSIDTGDSGSGPKLDKATVSWRGLPSPDRLADLPNTDGHESNYSTINDDTTLRESLNSTIMEFFRVRPPQPKPVFFNNVSLKSGFTSGDVVMSDAPELIMLQTYISAQKDNISAGSQISAQLSEVVVRLLEPPPKGDRAQTTPTKKLKSGMVVDPELDASTTSFGRLRLVKADSDVSDDGDSGGVKSGSSSFRGSLRGSSPAPTSYSTVSSASPATATKHKAPRAAPSPVRRPVAGAERPRGRGGTVGGGSSGSRKRGRGRGSLPLGASSSSRKMRPPSPPPIGAGLGDFGRSQVEAVLATGAPLVVEHPPYRRSYVKKITVPAAFFVEAKEAFTFEELFSWLLTTYDVVAIGLQRFFPLNDVITTIFKHSTHTATLADGNKAGSGEGEAGAEKGFAALLSSASRHRSARSVTQPQSRGSGYRSQSPPQSAVRAVASKNALRDQLCINCPRKDLKIEPGDNVFIIVPEFRGDKDDEGEEEEEDGGDDEAGEGRDSGGDDDAGSGDGDGETKEEEAIDDAVELNERNAKVEGVENGTGDVTKMAEEDGREDAAEGGEVKTADGGQGGGGGGGVVGEHENGGDGGGGDGGGGGGVGSSTREIAVVRETQADSERKELALTRWAWKTHMLKSELMRQRTEGDDGSNGADRLKALIHDMPQDSPCQHCRKKINTPPVMMSCGHLVCSDCLVRIAPAATPVAEAESGEVEEEGKGREGKNRSFSCPFCGDAVFSTLTLDESLTAM